jgi:hypothetical protein
VKTASGVALLNNMGKKAGSLERRNVCAWR